MYSLKPGRGPSAMGAVAGLFVAGFGVVWTIGALSMGAPVFPALFGLLFVGFALSGAIYNGYNAIAKNRSSTMDFVDSRREPDPLDPYADRDLDYRDDISPRDQITPRSSDDRFCPYCGEPTLADYLYCPGCGRQVGPAAE